MFRVIRKIDNPSILKAFAPVQEGGLGEVPDGFEEVELEKLPENYEMLKEKPQARGADFVAFVVGNLRFESRQTGKSLKQRLRLVKAAQNSFENFRVGGKNASQSEDFNLRDYLMSLDGMTQEEWSDFLQLVRANKSLNGNNALNIADELLQLAAAWEQTRSFA